MPEVEVRARGSRDHYRPMFSCAATRHLYQLEKVINEFVVPKEWLMFMFYFFLKVLHVVSYYQIIMECEQVNILSCSVGLISEGVDSVHHYNFKSLFLLSAFITLVAALVVISSDYFSSVQICVSGCVSVVKDRL
ncbi:unnamed protein product [Urochloa humidicola]